MPEKLPVFFHQDQLNHKPLFEWAFGEKIPHPETTSRAESILVALQASSDFDLLAPENLPIEEIKSLHNKKMVAAIRAAIALPMGRTFYPSVFPYHRDKSSLDPTNIQHAGAFCFDSGTPLNSTTYGAAAWSAACATEAAEMVVDGRSNMTYSLCRPPGHHASKDLFGGYCYFNNAALAAKALQRKYSRVTILDIDFHHGNGTQVLFERDPTVLVINIHGDPKAFYPYFTGFEVETGIGAGSGYNMNIPLPGGTEGPEYIKALTDKAIRRIRDFQTEALVVSAGFDTYVGDPIGGFCLEMHDFEMIGKVLAQLKLPTVVVQEGGYESSSLGRNVRALLEPFLDWVRATR